MALLPTQRDALRWAIGEGCDADLLLWEGDVRSGKSHGAAFALLSHSLQFKGQQFIVAGKSVGAVERNIIPKLRRSASLLGQSMRRVRSRGILEIGPNEFHIFGAPNAAAQDTVQGMDAAGVLIDEAALIERGFIDQALARTSVEGARSILTFNPSHPTHWLKTELIDADVGALFLRAELIDAVNAGVIPREYYDRQLSRLPPHKRKRWLEGVWAPAEGLCFPSMVERDPPPAGELLRVEAGVDFGIRDATAAIFFGEYVGKVWTTLDEYYWDAGERTAGEHAQAIIAMGERLNCTRYHVDPSAAALKLELQQRGGVVQNGRNDVITGIDAVEAACESGGLLVTAAAPNLLREASAYAWRAWDGPDQPDPNVDDHACDAARYFAMARLRKVDLRPVTKPAVFR